MDESIRIEGTVENVTFHNPDNGWSVIEVSSGNDYFTATGVFPEIAEGEEVVLFGVWTEHSTYGRQFRTDSYENKMPETSSQLLRFLSSGIVPGIGAKTAVKIIAEFGSDAIDVLQSHPERLCAVKGITRAKADKISEEFGKQFALRTIMNGFEKFGIKPSESISIFKELGVNSLNTVTMNPYILCGLVNGFDWFRCEEICSKSGVATDPKNRNYSALIYLLKYNYSNGHTCLPRDKLENRLSSMLGCGADEAAAIVGEMLLLKMIYSVRADDAEYIFTDEAYEAEKLAASKLLMMMRFPASDLRTIDEDIIRIEDDDNVCYETKQKKAIKDAASKGILILTGGPGTGKTTAIKGMIRLFEKHGMKIALAAPTGRAAKRMTEVTGLEAKTIHRLLEAEWGDDEKSEFARNVQNPLEADVVIVDEMSMVDVFLFRALVEAMRLGTRFVMVGDADQLPSVGPGNVLGDLIASEKFPVVRLTEIFRQAQSSLIVMNAHRIVNGETPETENIDSDFFFLPRPNSVTTASTVADLNITRLPSAYGFDPFDDIQVLCPSKKGECGTFNLNNRLQKLLNPPSEKKQEHRMETRTFRTGDKVMQIRNNYDLVWKKGDEDGTGIFNGDIGKLKKISHGSKTMTIDFDGRMTEYPMDKLQDLELAYAITIHKSQGSEFPAVIIPVIDAPEKLMYRNLVYTAVTRAKNLLIIIGSKEKLFEMIGNNRKVLRYTGLKYFITESEDTVF